MPAGKLQEDAKLTTVKHPERSMTQPCLLEMRESWGSSKFRSDHAGLIDV